VLSFELMPTDCFCLQYFQFIEILHRQKVKQNMKLFIFKFNMLSKLSAKRFAEREKL
jgi:hypothetical protein